MDEYGFFDWPYVGILQSAILLIVASFLIRFCTSWPEWTSSWPLGISSALLASYITVVIVDKSFRDEQAQEKARYEKIALRELRSPLQSHFELFRDWYAAACNTEDEFSHSTLKQAFRDDFSSTVSDLQFTLEHPDDKSKDWFEYSQESIKSFQNEMNEIQYKYSGLIGSEIADKVDNIRNSDFLFLFTHNVEEHSLESLDDDGIELLENHIQELILLLEYYDERDIQPIEKYSDEYLVPELLSDDVIGSGIET